MKYLACSLVTIILTLCLAQTAHAQGGPLVVAAGQVYTVSANTTYAGITVNAGGELRFAPGASVTISSTANVIVSGTLTMHPASAATVQTLRFIGINEFNFVGGGMVPLSTDVGLWVVGAGKLDILGTPKTSWTHAAGSIAAGATQVTLISAPTGWQVGDTISIAPTEPTTVGNVSWSGFDLRTITAISGTTGVITLSAPTTRAHPITVNPFSGAIYTAEVLNLTRNARIEGTGDGGPSYTTNHRAHIFIHSTQPQSILYATLRYLGPRKAEDGFTGDILGRYGLHFHMDGDGSRGSIVEGVVIRDIGSHAFVPHASHGIAFLDTISYNTFEEAYWWDAPVCPTCPQDVNDVHDITITHAVAALVRTDPTFRGYRLNGFTLGQSDNLSIRDSVAVGVQGNLDASGYHWPENAHAVWDFAGNVSHNNKVDGIFAWQNDSLPHVIHDFVSYNNFAAGIDHGAYGNKYQFMQVDLFGNQQADLLSRAQTSGPSRPDGYGLAFEDMRLGGTLLIGDHNQNPSIPVLIKDSILSAVRVNEPATFKAGWYDFVNVTKPNGTVLAPADFMLQQVRPTSKYRVQNGAVAWQMDSTGTVSTIAPFYVLPLSDLAQQVKDILDANPSVRQELVDAGVIH